MSSSRELQDRIIAALESMAEHGHPAPGSTRLLDVGNSDYLEYFEREVLDHLVSRGGATCRFIEGAYGSGKTHLLNALTEVALGKGYAIAQTDLTHAALKLEDWDKITAHILSEMRAVVGGEEVKSLPEILVRLGQQPGICAEKLALATLPHPGFKNAMVAALTRCAGRKSAFDLVSAFLLGHKVTASSFKVFGIDGIKSPLSKRNAELVLKTVLAGLYYLGMPGTVLCFDEHEKTFVYSGALPPKRIVAAAVLMRRLVDGGANGLLCGTVSVFAVLPGFLGNCSVIHPPLGQRLHLVQGPGYRAWRWPVLPIGMVNSLTKPEEFLDEAARTLSGMVATCGGKAEQARQVMATQGRRVLAANAGQGYKRELMRLLATVAVESI